MVVKEGGGKPNGCLVTKKSEDTLQACHTAGLPRIRNMTRISSPEGAPSSCRTRPASPAGQIATGQTSSSRGGHEVSAAEGVCFRRGGVEKEDDRADICFEFPHIAGSRRFN